MNYFSFVFSVCFCSAFLFSAQAVSQKSTNTIRLPIGEPIKTLDAYFFPNSEARPLFETIYEPLVRYDEAEGKFIPELARAWKRINDSTLEFELRDDVIFHNGDKFDADDVVYMANFRLDPSLKIPFRGRMDWMKGAEKVGPYTVRVYSIKPTPVDLLALSYSFDIFNSKIHSRLTDKSTYGRDPIGTGPVKVSKFDNNAGVILEPTDSYSRRVVPAWKKLVAVPMPDQQTQTAQLLSGGLEAIRVPSPDEFEYLAKNPNLHSISRDQFTIAYAALDARNRAGQPALSDPRVRTAIFMAINRQAIASGLIAGSSRVTDSFCYRAMQACPDPVAQVEYNPEEAKKLLAEAGYPDGFDLVISARSDGGPVAVAVSGDLRKIGIRASVQTDVPPNLHPFAIRVGR